MQRRRRLPRARCTPPMPSPLCRFISSWVMEEVDVAPDAERDDEQQHAAARSRAPDRPGPARYAGPRHRHRAVAVRVPGRRVGAVLLDGHAAGGAGQVGEQPVEVAVRHRAVGGADSGVVLERCPVGRPRRRRGGRRRRPAARRRRPANARGPGSCRFLRPVDRWCHAGAGGGSAGPPTRTAGSYRRDRGVRWRDAGGHRPAGRRRARPATWARSIGSRRLPRPTSSQTVRLISDDGAPDRPEDLHRERQTREPGADGGRQRAAAAGVGGPRPPEPTAARRGPGGR